MNPKLFFSPNKVSLCCFYKSESEMIFFFLMVCLSSIACHICDLEVLKLWVHVMCAWCRCKEWVQRSRWQDLLNKDVAKLYRNCHLCSDHFEESHSQFMNALEKKRLIWNAVPSVFNVPNPPPSVTSKQRLPGRKPVNRSSSSAKKPKLIGKWLGSSTFWGVVCEHWPQYGDNFFYHIFSILE